MRSLVPDVGRFTKQLCRRTAVSRFDPDETLTEVKIIDTLIWRFGAMLTNQGESSGKILYAYYDPPFAPEVYLSPN
jgi:hypothetical protein